MTDVELIISANGCTDNTRPYVEELQHKFSKLGFSDHVKLVWHDSALGFSRAVNEGIKVSTGQRVILMNNDVVLLDQPRNNWLDRLNAPFETNPRAGITSTLMLHSPQTGRDFAVFFCTMIDRKLINQIGMLDESYGVGAGEDIQYCYQAEQAGFEVVPVATTRYEPSIGTNASDFPIWHKAEGTMHDPNLVPNWNIIYDANHAQLAQRFEPHKLVSSTAELATRFPHVVQYDTSAQHAFQSVWQQNAYDLSAHLMRNKEVIDVGAHVGTFTIAAAALGAHKVLSFEPVKHNMMQLLHNLADTQLQHKVICHAQAVMPHNCEPLHFSPGESSATYSLYRSHTESHSTTVISLEDVMKLTFSRCVYLKLNCEGAEWDILMNSPNHVFDRIKYIHVHVNTQLHPLYNDHHVLETRLRDLGYSCARNFHMGMNWFDHMGQLVKWEPTPLHVQFWQK